MDEKKIEKKIENKKDSNNNIIKDYLPKKNSILNKIKHLPIILFEIFPFTTDRPIILPNLIENDYLLRNRVKKSLNRINKKYMPSKSIYYTQKFIVYKYMEGIDINIFLKNINKSIKYNTYKSLSCVDN